MVFDPRLAYAINHLYNHIHVLINLAREDPTSSFFEMGFLQANHPFLRDQASEFLDRLPKLNTDIEKVDSLRLSMINRLLEETKSLIEISASLALDIAREQEVQDNKSHDINLDHIRELEQSLARIPFIDYHSMVEPRPSIVQVINI